ncbi:MAG TPA: choice-of-anchor tandem repeat GloVer-containing protein [Candidatus Sulfotelmatobacter sp.]
MRPKRMIVVLAAALLFSFPGAAQNAKIKVLHNFGSSNDGNFPSGPPLLDNHGNLYGLTGGGPGQTGDGLVYELLPQARGGWKEKVLYSFTGGTGGSGPWGGLIFDSSGNLYGTLHGSPADVGAVFALNRGTGGWTFNVLYTAGIDRGDGPGVVFDGSGNLYGDIGDGQGSFGAIGELSSESGGWTYTQLYSICPQTGGCPDGYNEPVPPIWDASGNLWGTMLYGGIKQSPCLTSDGCGVIFEMTPNGDGTWTYDLIHQFASSSSDGQFPDGGLVMDAAGNFYGNTQQGGAYGHGTIFKFSFSGGQWVETVLYDFPNCVQGCYPVGTLAIDNAGNLYGTTIGGVHNQACGGFTCGEVFEMARQGNGRWKFTLLHKFVGADGDSPIGVIHDGKGNLFGTTMSGGTYNAGTAFEITP